MADEQEESVAEFTRSTYLTLLADVDRRGIEQPTARKSTAQGTMADSLAFNIVVCITPPTEFLQWQLPQMDANGD